MLPGRRRARPCSRAPRNTSRSRPGFRCGIRYKQVEGWVLEQGLASAADTSSRVLGVIDEFSPKGVETSEDWGWFTGDVRKNMKGTGVQYPQYVDENCATLSSGICADARVTDGLKCAQFRIDFRRYRRGLDSCTYILARPGQPLRTVEHAMPAGVVDSIREYFELPSADFKPAQ